MILRLFQCSFRVSLIFSLLWVCRGIDVVRNKIKMFAQKKVTLPPGRHKVVILDEADRFVSTFLTLLTGQFFFN